MLHELLFMLNGYHGNLFNEQDNGELRLLDDVPFITPSETAIINRLCQLGSFYKKFVQFSDVNSLPIVNGKTTGLYIRAFAIALMDGIEPYRMELVRLEKELLEDQHLSLTYVQCRLEEYHLIFPCLWNIVKQVIRHRSSGCQILEIIYRNLPAGLPNVKSVIDKIFCRCHQVLYHQLGAWLLHGMLLDRHEEFFIQRQALEMVSAGPAMNNEGSGSRVLGDDEQPLIDRWTKRQLEELLTNQECDGSSTTSGTANASQLARRFCLRPDMLPEYIPVPLAERILFVGESVHLFDLDPGDNRRVDASGDMIHEDVNSGLIEELEKRFSLRLRALSCETEFRLLKLEELVEDICTCVTSRLWTLLVEENDLIGHLRQMKDFFLLGRGELYMTFIDEADNLLSRSLTSGLEHEVNAAFQKAARAVLLDDESLTQRFSLGIGESNSVGGPEGDDGSVAWETGWDALNLRYSVRWPFHVLFTAGILEKYNMIFRFLIAVKRAQVALQSCWAIQMLEKGPNETSVKVLHTKQWLLRNHMAFLIDNLQYYLQVDVIESQFTHLLSAVGDKRGDTDVVRDIERIQLAHQHFVASLMAQAFLFNRPVYACLLKLMGLCLQFSDIANIIDKEPSRASDCEVKISQLQKNFQSQSGHLFSILSNVQTQLNTGSPHLAQLLLRLDFNKFYSSSGGKLGKIMGET